MPNPVQNISKESITEIKNKIENTIQNGIAIRKALAEYSNSDAYDINWEVQAAVEALQVLALDGLSKSYQHFTLLGHGDSTK